MILPNILLSIFKNSFYSLLISIGLKRHIDTIGGQTVKYMTEDEKAALKYLKKAYETRGSIIDHTIILERIIDDIICTHFTDNFDKKIEIWEMIISSMTYKTKVNILIAILKKIYPKNYNTRFKNIDRELGTISKNRNKFAHNILNSSPKENMEKYDISLVDYSNIKQVINYKSTDILNILKVIHKYILILNSVLSEIEQGHS